MFSTSAASSARQSLAVGQELKMRMAKVPAFIRITFKGTVADIPTQSIFFFPEGKTEFNLLEMRELLKEMEKMEEALVI